MKKRWLIALIAAYTVVRIYIATFSSYSFYEGWNEGWYSLIAKNYFSGSIWEQIVSPGADPIPNVPPMLGYVVYASFRTLGISDLSARIIPILSEVIAVSGVYLLTKEIYNEKVANLSIVLFLFIPWNILWFGRVATDPLLTAFMILSIAFYVRAYKSEKSMLPFGIVLGLAIFTKQPAIAVLPIVLIWSYFEGVKKKAIRNAIVCLLFGLIPLIIWMLYNLLIGNTHVVSHLMYGELVTRSAPFEGAIKVSAATFIGVTPLIFFMALYELIRMKNRLRNILFPWLVIYGVFVIVRTPSGHDNYSLPIVPVFAILAASAVTRFGRSQKAELLIVVALLASTIPFGYALLSYTGDLGYKATSDVGDYIGAYGEQHPQDTFFLITQQRYWPQIAWYTDLRLSGHSGFQVHEISNDPAVQIGTPHVYTRSLVYEISSNLLNNVSAADIEKLSNSTNATNVLLIIDDRGALLDRIRNKYEPVYSSSYETWLPNAAGIYTGEAQNTTKFGQKLVVFRLR